MTLDEEVERMRARERDAVYVGLSLTSAYPYSYETAERRRLIAEDDSYARLFVAKRRLRRALGDLRYWREGAPCDDCGASSVRILDDIYAVIARLAVILAATGGF